GSEDAVREALGLDMAGLDAAVRRWATTEAPEIWPSAEVEYDSLERSRPGTSADPLQALAQLFLMVIEQAAAEAEADEDEDGEDP
ncbi:MAG: hypothetical protein MI919_29545, partial [Holophagales bacterium]|nr:hypothetical protein [Holophagales bacterium]